MKPALFSATRRRLPERNGAGVIYTDLARWPASPPSVRSEGKGFEASVLNTTSAAGISEVLAMSVTVAKEFFGAGEVKTPRPQDP